MMVTRKVVMCMVVMCLMAAGVSQAVPVVRNGDFETTPGEWSGTYSAHWWPGDWITPDWEVSTDSVGLITAASASSTHGGIFAYVNNYYYMGQQALEAGGVTPSLVEAGMQLDFQLDVTFAPSYPVAAGSVSLQLLTMPGDLISDTPLTLDPTGDVWTTTSVTTDAVGAGSSLIGQAYYYRVIVWDTTAIGDAQAWFDNISVQASQSATLVSPANGEVDVDKSTEDLVWSAPYAGYSPTGYNLVIRAGDPNFADTVNNIVSITNGSAASPYDISGFGYDTTYYWRVDTEQSGSIIHQGPVWSFTTLPEGPRIDTQPVGQVRGPANGKLDAVLTIAAINNEGYQWYYDNGNGIADPLTDILLSGEDANTLTLTGVTLGQEGGYFCVATHSTLQDDVSEIAYVEYARQTSQWDFENTLVDSIGGKNGTWSGASAVYGTGIVGSLAIDFPVPADGSSIDVPVAALPRNGKEVTISLWAKNGPMNTLGLVPFTALDSTGANVISAAIPWWDGNVLWITGDPVNPDDNQLYPNVGVDALEGAWNHWVFTHNSEDGYMAIYRNGVTVASYTGALGNDALGAVSFEIGSAAHASDSAYQGLIDDFKIYNYAISAVKAAYLYTDVSSQTVCVESPSQHDVAGGGIAGDEPDCIVNLQDFAALAADWMNCNLVPDCLPRP